jgi:hypothetical protein
VLHGSLIISSKSKKKNKTRRIEFHRLNIQNYYLNIQQIDLQVLIARNQGMRESLYLKLLNTFDLSFL